MTTHSAPDAHARAVANQPVPLTNQQVLDKYTTVFDKIWAAAGSGLFYLNLKLLDTQYDELAAVLQAQGYGISTALPTSVETYTTNTTGISVTGLIGNGLGGSGNLLVVTVAANLGLSAGIPITGNGITAGTYITSITPSYSLGITGGTKQLKTFTANVTQGSNTLTSVQSFDNVAVNARLTGTNIASGAVVSSFNVNASTITMSLPATGGSSTSTNITFPIFTVQTAASPGWVTGMKVVIAGQPDGHYNGNWTISGGVSSTQYQVTPDNTWTDPPVITGAVGTVTPTGASGGVGYYQVNNSQSVASRTITSYWFTVGNSQGMVPNAKINFSATSVTTRAFQTYTNGNIAVDSTAGLYPGMPVRFLGNSLGGITANKVYYVVNATAGILTVSNDNASGSVVTWTDDSSYAMTVTAGGVFGGVVNGQTYYIHSVPDANHVVVSQTLGGDALTLTSSIGYMKVTGDTAASNLIPAVAVYTGPDSIGYSGNDYIISW